MMKQTAIRFKRRMAACLCLLAAAVFLTPALAEVDATRTGVLTVCYRELDSAQVTEPPQMQLALFRVADVEETSGALKWTLTAPWQGSGVSLAGMTNASLEQSRAQALSDYARRMSLSPVATELTDAQGKARFADLPVGLYLLYAWPVSAQVLSAPILVSLPSLAEKGYLDYVPTVYPKLETIHSALLINKTGSDGKALPGAEFRLELLTDGAYRVVREGLITDAKGQIALENLVLGTYRLTETKAPDGCVPLEKPVTLTLKGQGTLTISGGVYTAQGGAGVIDVVNAYTPSPSPTPLPTPDGTQTSYTVTKKWSDSSNAYDTRPASIRLRLERRKITEKRYTAVVTVDVYGSGGAWRYTFTRLPIAAADGAAYEYRVREEAVSGYTVAYDDDNHVITNTRKTGGGGGGGSSTPTPLVSVAPAPTPERAVGVAYVDGEWVYVDVSGVPLGKVPQTGDDDNLTAVLLGAALLLTLAAVLTVVLLRKRGRTGKP